ncbi:hypothetical protein SO802_004565 [Lithocarpus litseifolius]|uniref:Uncharacterized protein n=1 Tax=Lithocarpus litseifolius TaxID=425828 RepID=A0AAW2E919_9ROSI
MAEWLAFGLPALEKGSGDLRWKFVSKKTAMTVKEDGFAGRGNRLTMVFMGCNKRYRLIEPKSQNNMVKILTIGSREQ